MRGGLLLVILGVFIVARTVTKDATGRTLVDRIHPPSSGSTSGGTTHTTTQIAPLPTPAQQRQQIAAQGYVTDNYSGSVGTTKSVTGPAPSAPSLGSRVVSNLMAQPKWIHDNLLP
ncbi:MAG: hypothetical protein M3Y09_20195 [Actinomycetota bacterium]|nr:hypothetical protein [Actinomycetota bacterium]